MTTARVLRIAAELRKRGVPVSDMEMFDAFLDLIGDDDEAEKEFLDWLTGDMQVRAGELAEAMIARAGRRQVLLAAEPAYDHALCS